MIHYGTNFVAVKQLILQETNEMKKFFSIKACQISIALNQSWHLIFFFSLIAYLVTYTFLHFQKY